MANNMKWYDIMMISVIIIGSLNWGLVGFFNFNLVTWLINFTPFPILERIIYGIVGVFGLLSIFRLVLDK